MLTIRHYTLITDRRLLITELLIDNKLTRHFVPIREIRV